MVMMVVVTKYVFLNDKRAYKNIVWRSGNNVASLCNPISERHFI